MPLGSVKFILTQKLNVNFIQAIEKMLLLNIIRGIYKL